MNVPVLGRFALPACTAMLCATPDPHIPPLPPAHLTLAGMKGMATVRMLRQLEQRTGRHISELFDLIVGTSTGERCCHIGVLCRTHRTGSLPSCCTWQRWRCLSIGESLSCCTCAGGLLAVAVGLRRMSLDDCEDIYKVRAGYISAACV